MKTKTTIKNIKYLYKNVYQCGYCELQDIYYGLGATYYNAGVYGWNCDIYTDFARDIAITTGYRNMTGKQIPNELIIKYSKIARNILADSLATPWEEIKNALEKNRENFLDELLNI